MSQLQYAVIIVFSTSHALRIEKLLQAKGLTCKLIPVPRQISSDCGMCIRILRSDVAAASQAIESAQVEIEGIHEI
jgi:hypothetical protein